MSEQNGHLLSEVLQAFLEGELPDAERVEAEAHLEGCARCASELEGWSLLFAELRELPEVNPSVGFADRVMERIANPAPAPAPVPFGARLLALLPRRRGAPAGHPAPERIQDLLDGAIRGRAARTIRSHLAACQGCRTEVEAWEGVFASLRALPHLSPTDGFADRVMDRLDLVPEAHAVTATRPAAAAAAAATRLLAALGSARRLVPSTRRGWAIASAAFAAPAVGLAVLIGSVVLHPLLSFGDIALYATWRGAEAVQGVIGWMGGVIVQSPILYQLSELLGSLAAAPALAAGVLLALWVLTLASAWVLYRQVIVPNFSGNRNVQAS